MEDYIIAHYLQHKDHYSYTITPEHFNESYAKYLVAGLYHMEDGYKHIGEKFDMNKAKEVHVKYHEVLPDEVTVSDVYVAINIHYHDYCQLYKAWFSDSVDQRIIESAIVYWFKDEDCKHSHKLHHYLK